MRKPFALEQTYRQRYQPHLFDLSSSAPQALTLADLFPDGVHRDSLLETSLCYGPGGGNAELREAVAALYPGLGAENVLITAGAAEAIRVAAMALVSEGSKVLVQAPAYAALQQAVSDEGAEVVELAPGADGSFDLRSASRADIAMLNSPYGFGGASVQGLEAFRGRMIVDEVYRPIELVPNTRSRSAIDMVEGAVAVGDLSKPLGLGGLRVGWLVSHDRDAIERCAAALDYLSGSISVLSAVAGLAALQRFDEILGVHAQRARCNLSTWAEFAERYEDSIDWTPPQAGFNIAVRLRHGPLSGDSFERLREAGVYLLPGEVLGWPDHLRIGIGGDRRGFCRALERLGAELDRLPSSDLDRRTGTVVLLTKVPQHGYGKSRLAAEIGASAAFELATAFLSDSLELATSRASNLLVAVDPPASTAAMASTHPDAEVIAQRGASFGERLCAAFEDAFLGGATNPVLIGSDSPTLPSSLLSIAHRALETHDVVVGPAEDGGYYAVGLRAPTPSIFRDIDWSTDAVLSQTVQRCTEADLSVFFLPYWYDVDTAADLDRLGCDSLLRCATAAALERISS